MAFITSKNLYHALTVSAAVAASTIFSPGAHAFSGKQIASCSDNFVTSNPYRVVNTVYADMSKPQYMLLKFTSTQKKYPFDGIITATWHNLSSGKKGHFQEQRHNNKYTIAAVPTGAGTVALAIRFNNTLTGKEHRRLATAQCNALVDVISHKAPTVPPGQVSHPVAPSQPDAPPVKPTPVSPPPPHHRVHTGHR